MATTPKIEQPKGNHVIPLPRLVLGAVIGAVVVLVVGGGLGELIEGLAPTPVLVVMAVAGAIFGALAAGAISYERPRSPAR